MPETQNQITIFYPPDFVFKFPRNRQAPAQEVLQEQNEQSTFRFVGAKYPPLKNKGDDFFAKFGMKRENFNLDFTEGEEKMGGQLVYFEGVKHPAKGHPFPQAMYAISLAKRLTRTLLNFAAHADMKWIFLGLLFTSPKNRKRIISRFLQSYAEVCGSAMKPFILDEDFMTPCANEILKFLHRFFKLAGINEYTKMAFEISFSEMLANQIEYDNVYRLKIEDVMSETTKEKMLQNPRRELQKICRVLVERDPDWHTAIKFEQAIQMLCLLLLIPKYNRIFKECVRESSFERFQYDDADRHHVLLIEDYRYMGMPIWERFEKYKEIYKEALPPRIDYKAQ